MKTSWCRVAAGLAVAFSSTLPAAGVTRYVSQSGGNAPPYTNWSTAARTITAAVQVAVAGDVVWVTNGAYVLTSTVMVPQGVTIQSVNGYSNTIVDGNAGTWRCFYLTASGGVLRGFTVKRGNASGSSGGGVAAASYTRIHDCLITGNVARTAGGGVDLNSGAILSNCVITGNTVGDTHGGGGVYSAGGLIEDCIISDNVSQSPYGGAGAYCVSGARMRRCVVTRNRSGINRGWQQGAGIWAEASFVEDCEVSYNRAPEYYAGGGIMCYAGSVVSGCTVRANLGWECGGIYLNGGTVLNSLIENNTSGFYRAGGVEVKVGSVESCVIRGNYAEQSGGGVSILNGTVRNCLIVDNVAGKAVLGIGGGGVGCEGSGVLENCTVARNSAGAGGGVFCQGSYVLDVRNTIVYGNTADTGANYLIQTGATFTAVCTEPFVPGPGNTDEDPGFASPDSGNFRLLPGSPCLDRGTNDAWMLAARDLDGRERVLNNVVDLGAYESDVGPLAGNAIADVTEGPGPLKVVFEAFVSGTNTVSMYYRWDFNGDGTVELEGYGLRVVTSSYAIGRFDLALTVSNAVGETYTVFKPAYVKVGPAIAYVRRSGSTPVYPFTNWVNAATNIQQAVDAGEAGTLVLVTDGTYRVSAPLAVRNRITVRSVRGAAFTAMDGGDTNRCVELRHPDAIVDGFTLKNGYAYGQNALGGAGGFLFGGGLLRNCTIVSNRTENYGSGAGVVCFWGGALSNCVVTDNNSAYEGGGIVMHAGGRADNCTIARNIGSGSGGGVHLFSGELRRSIIRGNQAGGSGGGVRLYGGGLVEDCLVESNVTMSANGGGVANDYNPATISRCIIRGNACGGNGGGIGLSSGGLIENCVIYSNRAGYAGGGVAILAGGILQNSTVIENQATNFGGGLYTFGGATTRNSILFFNTCGNGSNIFEDGHVETWFNNCVAPNPGGSNNISVNPLLAPITAGVFRLSATSPCIDAGAEEGAPPVDVEGIARPLDGNADAAVAYDIGASEFAHTNVDADVDGLSDATEAYVWHTGVLNPDTDGDNMMDGSEIRAGTDPWSPSSYLGIENAVSAPAGGYVVQWQSVSGKRYRLERSTNLVSGAWIPVFTNILGVAPMNTVTDTTAAVSGPWMYRIELE